MEENAEKIVSWVRAGASPFYRELWGAGESFEKLPFVSRVDMVRVPLSHRRYKDERALVKIVHSAGGPFLSEWSFEDIAREPFGVSSKRPMVYMTDPHEALEKSIWCYDNGMVPLIGEKDADVASYSASKYQIDQLITDIAALERLRPYLDSRSEQLEALTLIGDAFDLQALASYAPYARMVRCVLALPETGVVAVATLPDFIFKPRADCILEEYEDTLVVTKVSMLVTPIVKYLTEIQSDMLRI